jgi:16S rRNA processing protein RimM
MADAPPHGQAPDDWDAMPLVGRVTRTHGLRGEVVVHPETDFVDERFAVGQTVWMRAGGTVQPLTVRTSRSQNGRAVVGFEGCAAIDEAERLVGVELRIPASALMPLAPGVYYEHDLVGCMVHTLAGREVGMVQRIDGTAGAVRLVVSGARGEVLVPLASAICVTVDTAARRIRIDPPEGLIELNEVRHRHDLSEDGPRGARRGRHRTGD